MDEQKARKILGDWIQPNNCLGTFIDWNPEDEDEVLLDGCFTSEHLAAIAWWMSHMKVQV